ncbi:MAG: hypothetical protein GY924_00010 [Planctomycetaceae bacterium]|nr:hypothetical protein [Planctomycetaceae bacterium]|tara:strand:- start:713 stop:979 length:267 start_codon:yes stop_codon:yes gene_type:complete
MSTPENPSENNSHPWLRGAAVSGIGVVIGIVSLVLFCHALGLNLRDQGWGSGSDSWNTNRGEVIVSFIGFGIGTVIFWLGFHQTTKPN